MGSGRVVQHPAQVCRVKIQLLVCERFFFDSLEGVGEGSKLGLEHRVGESLSLTLSLSRSFSLSRVVCTSSRERRACGAREFGGSGEICCWGESRTSCTVF